MKPIDLQVGIQNSYEAARSEAVRLEKTHVAEMQSNENAKREQVIRDQSVLSVESKNLVADLFSEEQYKPDLTDKSDSSSEEERKEKEKRDAEEPQASDESETPSEENATDGRFSTFA